MATESPRRLVFGKATSKHHYAIPENIMKIRQNLVVLAIYLLAAAIVSVWLGQDLNYDLANYHLYDGPALLTGRFGRDLLPSDIQGGFNPLLDALYAAAALGPLSHSPRWLAAFMGLWAGIAAYLTLCLAKHLYPGRPVLAAIGVAMAVTAAPFVAEIGTTFNDIPTASLMLGGLVTMAGPRPNRAKDILAGALFGAAAGLKLTAVVYAPAGCLAVACLGGNTRSAMRAIALFLAGWLLGWLVCDAWWALKLWRLYGSPYSHSAMRSFAHPGSRQRIS